MQWPWMSRKKHEQEVTEEMLGLQMSIKDAILLLKKAQKTGALLIEHLNGGWKSENIACDASLLDCKIDDFIKQFESDKHGIENPEIKEG